jgi:hypothetical protein
MSSFQFPRMGLFGSTAKPTIPMTTTSSISSTPSFLKSDKLFDNAMMFAGVLLLIATSIYVIVIYAERYKNIRNVITQPMVAANSGILIKSKDFPTTIPNRGIKFTLSMWMYISSWMYNRSSNKDIFRKGDFRIYLDRNQNDLIIETPIFPVKTSPTSSLTDTYMTIDYLRFKNFPLQKWVNVVVIVDSRTVDLWINGKLYQSLNLPNIVYFNNADDVFIVADGLPQYREEIRDKNTNQPTKLTILDKAATKGGFDGYISGITYYKYPLQRDEIVAIFENGPYPTNFVNKYVFRLLQELFMSNIPIQVGGQIDSSRAGKVGGEILDQYIESNATVLNPIGSSQ